MPRFPSEEWMDAFCRTLAADPRAGDVADALDGVYRFVIEPAGPLAERHLYDVEIRPSVDGGAPSVHRLTWDGEPRLTMTADYTRWRQLINGELDVGIAVMLRRLRVSGDLSSLMGRVSSAQPLLDAIGAVETDWR